MARLPVFLTNSTLCGSSCKGAKVRCGTELSFRQALVMLGWVLCASSAVKERLVEGILQAQSLQAKSRVGIPRAHVKSQLKIAYLASKLPLASSADSLPRKLIVESSCRHTHMSFLPEIQSVSYSKCCWLLGKLRTTPCICSGGAGLTVRGDWLMGSVLPKGIPAVVLACPPLPHSWEVLRQH